MEILRKSTLPFLYTFLPFVRESAPCFFADCKEDLEYINELQSIALGKDCISILERSDYLIIKANFPKNLLKFKGETNKAIRWKYYFWKLWDVEYFIQNMKPAEAIDINQANIDSNFLEKIANKSSCIDLLSEIEKYYTLGKYKGYNLTEENKKKLLSKENKFQASINISQIKKSFNQDQVSLLNSSIKNKNFKFDVAISFAGENRDIAHFIANNLEQRDISVFYDNFYTAKLWGEDLYDELFKIYSEYSKYCIVLVSKYYIEKMWTIHEFKAIKDRLLKNQQPYLLQIKLDNTILPNISSAIGYIDYYKKSKNEIINLIIKKII